MKLPAKSRFCFSVSLKKEMNVASLVRSSINVQLHGTDALYATHQDNTSNQINQFGKIQQTKTHTVSCTFPLACLDDYDMIAISTYFFFHAESTYYK